MEMLLNILKAFLLGGIICLIGQLLIDYTKLTPAKILVGFVVLGVILGGCGLYEHLVDFGGAGATIPLTGFGYALAKGTKESIMQEGIIGALEGPLSSASIGIMAAVLCGLVCSIFTRSKDKK